MTRVKNDIKQVDARIKETQENIKRSTKLPYMVATVGELLTPVDNEEAAKDGSGLGASDKKKPSSKKEEESKVSDKAIIVKTTNRQSYYLPNTGLIDCKELKPGELIAVNKDSFIVYEKLPPEYDSRVKAMEVDERPTEEYGDIGGLDKQIEELVEAIVLPMTQKERF